MLSWIKSKKYVIHLENACVILWVFYEKSTLKKCYCNIHANSFSFSKAYSHFLYFFLESQLADKRKPTGVDT